MVTLLEEVGPPVNAFKILYILKTLFGSNLLLSITPVLLLLSLFPFAFTDGLRILNRYLQENLVLLYGASRFV